METMRRGRATNIFIRGLFSIVGDNNRRNKGLINQVERGNRFNV